MAKRSSSAVEIKGYGNDVNIVLSDEAVFSDVEAELIKKLEDSDRFFSGVSIVLDMGNRVFGTEECEKLKEVLIDRFNLVVSAVRSHSDETRRVVEKLGWKIEAPPQKEQEKKKGKIPALRENDTILHRQTLRSGQRLWHPGNVVIMGDVNPGAEVVATGDIIVLGKLRGIAHAGVEGDASARIIALNLDPIQLRIAEYIGRSPDLNLQMDNVPEMASIEDGNIVIRKLR